MEGWEINMQSEKKSITKSNQRNSIIRAFKILKILQEQTDKENSMTQNQILDKLKAMGDTCDLKTLSKTLRVLIEFFNPIHYSEENRNSFRIIFQGYSDNKYKSRLTNIYYNHEFSYEEICNLIESIQFSKTVDTKTAKIIIKKVKKLINTQRSIDITKIERIPEFSTIRKEELRENLGIIQKAIENKYKIMFYFNGYNHNKQLIKVKEKKYLVSPYYVVAYNNRYYLISNTEPYNNISIYRIDLMTEVESLEGNKEYDIKKISARAKKEIKALPVIWQAQDFMLEHMNMFYDDPVEIRLKVKNNTYTYIHDYFGDKFKFKRKVDDNYDIIEVTCSPNAVVHFAMQYSEYVEVIDPLDVRNMVIESIKKMCKKYEV